MKLLRCKLCSGEMDIINNEYAINKQVKCRQCGYYNNEPDRKGPEVIIMRKRPTQD